MMFNSTTLSKPDESLGQFLQLRGSRAMASRSHRIQFFNHRDRREATSANGIIPPNATSATWTLAMTQDFYLQIVTTSISLGDADLAPPRRSMTSRPTHNISFTRRPHQPRAGHRHRGHSSPTPCSRCLQFVSATPSPGTTYDPSTGIWTVGTVTEGPPPLTLVIQARVVSPGEHTNVATIDHSDQYDPNPGNNSAAETVTPRGGRTSRLAKEVDNPTPNVGSRTSPTQSSSPTLARIQLPVAPPSPTPFPPACMGFVSATTTERSYDDATGIWTVGTVTVGATPLTLTIVALVTTADAAVNVATIAHSNQYDPDPTNNTAEARTELTAGRPATLVRVNDPRPNVGNTITFTVDLWNYGPSTATSVTVSDPLPAGLQIASAPPPWAATSMAQACGWCGTLDRHPARAPETLAIQAASWLAQTRKPTRRPSSIPTRTIRIPTTNSSAAPR